MIALIMRYNNLLQMLKMAANDRNKMIQNYSLEELKFINLDQSQLWTAKHIILKKSFTLRRVKYNANSTPIIDKALPSNIEEWKYQNMVNEANLLKRLKTEHAPTCHKMIKTSNNIYLVYDEFPSLNLKEFISKNPPNRHAKLQLMNRIAKALKNVHSLAVFILVLSWENIYLKENKDLLFGDWSLACTNESLCKIYHKFLSNKYGFFAPQIICQGKYSAFSDIYSLGKIFDKIYKAGFLEQPSDTDSRLLSLINSMTNEQSKQRPQLADIIKALQDCSRPKSSSFHSNHSNISISVNAPNKSSSKTFLKIKQTISFAQEQRQDWPNSYYDIPETPKTTKTIKSPRTPQAPTTPRSPMAPPSPRSPRTPNQRKTSSCYNQLVETKTSINTNNTNEENGMGSKVRSRVSLQLNASLYAYHINEPTNSQKQNQDIKLIKVYNKNRNLAFFLSNLAEFVIRVWICPELGYLLLKYAKLTLKSILNSRQIKSVQSDLNKKFIPILKRQIQVLDLSVNGLAQNFEFFQNDKRLTWELGQGDSINDRYLKQKIVQFGKEMVRDCHQHLTVRNKSSTAVDNLFKTYMILKKIEEGSYQSFWERIYNADQAFLKNQSYFDEEKSLGAIYITTKIGQILKGR